MKLRLAAIRGALKAGQRSRFVRNSVIVTGISGVERIGAVVQTILIARALGIVEYGIYGLLFTTIGLVASVVGLQMGLTATVLIARYRVTDKSNAGAVIRHVNRFAVLVALAFVLACLPASGWISQALFKSPDYAAAVLLGVAFIGVTLISGVQDGIVQGFEDFTAMARARLIAAFVTLVLIYPGAIVFGLTGVVAVILGGVGIKMAMLSFVVQSHRRREAIPSSGGTIRFWSMVVDFSLPSMLVSLLMGGSHGMAATCSHVSPRASLVSRWSIPGCNGGGRCCWWLPPSALSRCRSSVASLRSRIGRAGIPSSAGSLDSTHWALSRSALCWSCCPVHFWRCMAPSSRPAR